MSGTTAGCFRCPCSVSGRAVEEKCTFYALLKGDGAQGLPSSQVLRATIATGPVRRKAPPQADRYPSGATFGKG